MFPRQALIAFALAALPFKLLAVLMNTWNLKAQHCNIKIGLHCGLIMMKLKGMQKTHCLNIAKGFTLVNRRSNAKKESYLDHR